MSVSISDIAREASVSEMTVSNVLRGKGRFSPETGQRVRKVAKSLGYRPHAGAAAIRSGRFGAIGLLRSESPSLGSMPADSLLAIEKGMAEANLHLVLGLIPDAEMGQRMPKILREWSVDALLISYTANIPAEMRRVIVDNAIPSAWINVKQDADCVRPDDFGAMRDATARLIGLGHRRVAYFGWQPHPGTHYSTQDRYDGYLAAMSDAGLTPDPVWTVQTQHKGCDGYIPIDRYIEKFRAAGRPTAVVTQTVTETYAATWQAGLTLAKDLSVIALRAQASSVCGVAPTQVVAPSSEIGRLAVSAVLGKIEDPTAPQPPVVVPFGWHEGETVGAISAEQQE